jgi:hypothetical protein
VKRPSKIRVLGKKFSVEYCSGSPLDDGLNGECDYDNQQILVREGQPLESEQDTLLHEVLHAIDESMGLKLKESQVKGAATGLLAVLKDNASLGSYLRRKHASHPSARHRDSSE